MINRCDYFIIKMSSPPRYQHQIQAQIKKRIVPEAITPNDLDFYVRKVRRLQTDNAQLTDELNKLRVRLRRAQDFQIKHELLLNENSNLKKQLEARDHAVRDLKTLNEKLTISVEQRTNKHEEWGLEKRGLLEEVEKWTLKAEENEVRRVSEIAQQRTRCEEAIKRQALIAKKDFEDRDDQYRFEIRQLKKILHEKEAVETIVTNRVEKIRKEKDEEIARLGAVIQDEKEQRAQSIDEKNDEISRLKQKFEKMINFELENIKKNLEDQDEVFIVQLNGLKQIISIKNEQIGKLLEQIKSQATDHNGDRDDLLSEIKSLKGQIYKIEREGEQQLYNLRQKLIEIHGADLKQLEKRYEENIQTLRNDKGELERFLTQKDRLSDQERKDHERNIQEFQDKIKEREQRISTLLDRLKQNGDLNNGQLKDLHYSLHKIQAEKETLTYDYENNVTFMTQQIAKLTAANKTKNEELEKLKEEFHKQKRKFEEEMKEFDLKMKEERKMWTEEKERQRRERERLIENMATAERDFKNTEKRLIRGKEKEEREKNKLKFLVEQLERDVQRLNKYIKDRNDSLNNEYKKNQMNILDGDSARRDAVSRLEKQKIEIQTLKNIELDQVKRKYELDTTRFIQENEKLKTDLVTKSVALQKAEAEVKRLDYNHRNMEKINKQKLLDYEKKMATLNNEIHLTTQLYKTFVEAKARKNQ